VGTLIDAAQALQDRKDSAGLVPGYSMVDDAVMRLVATGLEVDFDEVNDLAAELARYTLESVGDQAQRGELVPHARDLLAAAFIEGALTMALERDRRRMAEAPRPLCSSCGHPRSRHSIESGCQSWVAVPGGKPRPCSCMGDLEPPEARHAA
jgi:hypothetical protein